MARYERHCKRSVVHPQRSCVDYAAVHMYGYDATDCEEVPSERMPALRRARFDRCLAEKVAASETARQAAVAAVSGKLKGNRNRLNKLTSSNVGT